MHDDILYRLHFKFIILFLCFCVFNGNVFLRFGEEPLHSCEVMLHDIDSSKRLNTAITAAMKEKNDGFMHDTAVAHVRYVT